MSIFRAVSPRRAWADFRNIWMGEQAYKPRFLLLSLAATLTIFLTFFFGESGFEGDPPTNEIIYFENWSLERSDEDIVAERFEVFKQKLKEEKLQQDRAEVRREIYRDLGRMSGMNVDDE